VNPLHADPIMGETALATRTPFFDRGIAANSINIIVILILAAKNYYIYERTTRTVTERGT
jgi:hypothetical protein